MDNIEKGKLYFVKDEFFAAVEDKFLKVNKEQNYRPHYYAFQDPESGLLWLIPCSSQISKYERIIAAKKQHHKPSNHIQIIAVSGKKQVFLYQDMFPILPKYIMGVYKNIYGEFQIKDPKLLLQIEVNAKKIIKLLRHGVKFTPTQPDINRIEHIMLEEQKDFDLNKGEGISSEKISLQDRIDDAREKSQKNHIKREDFHIER
ncbi:type III toxin-antitoxin system CptIN family toxin [Caproiciproducens galactitolivorans]|uniref:Uncharacterized protein n=1 Tax=Caproiciproducens galactitolivorans TaxID=642589 RepID=A0ABT4BPS6_9FIRM|nr:hypothetical protein [Caproiciproducens galactitolivorans]MCY1712845.1 hypothetical protein [Caproiciproducens galactitolivorans]